MDSTDPEITELKAHLAATRERRIAAQKETAALPRLRRSLTRVERDASSGTTTQVEALGQQIGQLREEITVSAHSIDNIRVRVHGLAPRHKTAPSYDRLTRALAAEAEQRRALREDPRVPDQMTPSVGTDTARTPTNQHTKET